MVDLVKALKRPFSDVNKFLIGTLLGIIPIVNFTVIGYKLVSTGFTEEKVERDSLPEWKNYGDLFVKGLVSVVIGIILFLPAALIILGTFGTVIIAPALSMIFGGISPETWEKIMTGQITDVQIQDWFAQNWMRFISLLLNATPFLLFGALLALLAYYISPVAILGWLKENRLSAAFSWGIIKKAVTVDYLVNWIVVGIITMIVSAL